jgi:hypothetical protein
MTTVITASDSDIWEQNIRALRELAAAERSAGRTDQADKIERLAERWQKDAGDALKFPEDES